MSRSLTGASVLALATVCMASPVFAQVVDNTAAPEATATSTPSAEDTVVVVTGLRKSLASAQAIKKNSEQLVDSITAQDIGKFPDVNIAESLQRISGIQIQRNLGEGSVIAIRGLSQVRTELNGHDIFTANGGVGLSFEEVGPDLLSRVDVYKNPSAELIEGSLGGTINLITRKPFDAKGRVLSATASTTYYDLEKKTGKSISALYSDRWTTGAGDVGFLANASYQTSFFRQDVDQVEPYYNHGPDGGTPVPGYEDTNVKVQKGGGFNVAEGGRERNSQSVVLQWRPSDDIELYAQIFNTTYKFYDTGVSFFATDEGAAPVGDYVVVDGVAVSGALANPGGSDVTYASRRDTRTTQFSTGMKWALRDNLHLVLDYEHLDAEVKQDSVNLTINPYTSTNGVAGLFNETYNYTFDNSGEYPVQGSDNPDFFSNADNYGFTAIQPNRVGNTATDDSVRADLTWDFDNDFFHSFSTGARYSRKTAINRETNINNWQTIGGTCANWSSAANCYKVSDHMDFVELNPGQSSLFRDKAGSQVFGPVWQWKLDHALNPELAFADVKAISGQDISFGDLNNPTQSTTSTEEEKDFAFYMRTSFGSNVGTWMVGDYQVNFDGNAGLRYVNTDESAQGFEILSYRTTGGQSPTSASVISAIEGGRKYDFWLPSLNLRMHLTPAIQLRFAASQNINRPNFTQLNPTFSLSPNYTDTNALPNTVNADLPYDPVTNPYQGSGSVYGDPNLKPERVTSYDAALEWYFTNDSYAYVTFFTKAIDDLIATRSFTRTETLPNVGVVQFDYTSVTNVEKGSVKGFEIGGQKFFDFLPGPLSGLGVAANYTLANSDAGVIASTSIDGTTEARVPLINLSKHSYNLMLLYDKNGWNGRIAYNWRDKYLDSISEVGTASLPIYFKAYGSLDASVSYDFNPHVSLTLDAQNLTNTIQQSYQVESKYLRNYQMNDRRVSARLRVSY
jgi:TonB-dependent receptor